MNNGGDKKVSFFDYLLFVGKLEEINVLKLPTEKAIFNTINPHSFYVAEHDITFKQSLIECDYLLPDGVGVVLANLIINGKLTKKIAGIDIFLATLRTLHQSIEPTHKKIFFLGSSVSVLDMIRNRINSEYPSLEVHAYSPPFKAEFSDEDNAHMASAINFIKPYALFVGMTAPKQEKWVLQNRNSLNTHCIFSIGAVFDFYSGKIKRPGIIWRSLGLEWLGRFLSEPKRLWRRSLISLPYFLSHVFKEAFLKRFR